MIHSMQFIASSVTNSASVHKKSLTFSIASSKLSPLTSFFDVSIFAVIIFQIDRDQWHAIRSKNQEKYQFENLTEYSIIQHLYSLFDKVPSFWHSFFQYS